MQIFFLFCTKKTNFSILHSFLQNTHIALSILHIYSIKIFIFLQFFIILSLIASLSQTQSEGWSSSVAVVKVDRSLLRLSLKSTLTKTTAEQNPRSAQVDVEFSRMFFAEDVKDKRGNFFVGEEGTGGESRGDEIVAVEWCGGRRVRRGRMGNKERREVVEGEGGVVEL